MLRFNNVSCTSIMRQTYDPCLSMTFPELPGLVFAAFIVDRIGCKHSTELVLFLGFVFLLPLLSHQSEILTTLSLFGSRMFNIGTFTIANIYAPEIYPSAVRAAGVGLASSVGRVEGMVLPPCGCLSSMWSIKRLQSFCLRL